MLNRVLFANYIGVNNTGAVLIDTTTSISQDYTQRKVVDHSSLFLLFTTDDVESNDGDGFEMYILESWCLTPLSLNIKLYRDVQFHW
jgi:hypothetical protein